MIKSRKRILFIVLGINRKHDTKLLLSLDIILEFKINLTKIGLLSYLDSVRTVVAYNAAPQCIVEVKNKSLLVLSVNRLDYICHIKTERRYSLNAERILVHMPCKRI